MEHHCLCKSEKTVTVDAKASGKISILPEQDVEGKIYYIQLDFGEVVVGRQRKKSVYIKNDSRVPQCFNVLHPYSEKIIYCVFKCFLVNEKRPYRVNEVAHCKVVYRPYTPDEMNYDRFEIMDGSMNKHVIICKGRSIGPAMQVSTKHIYFFITKNKNIRRNTFELKNVSKVDAVFQFPLTSRLFRVNPMQGVIPPKKNRFIQVEFVPSKKGVYAEKLWCLLSYQEPLMVLLYGMNQPHINFNSGPRNFQEYHIPIEYRTGSTGFFERNILLKSYLPVTLNKGHLVFDESRILNCAMMNHTDKYIRIMWIEDEEGLFTITPKEIFIPPKVLFSFECQFNPKKGDNIYCKSLVAQVYWYEQPDITRGLVSVHKMDLKNLKGSIDVADVPLSICLRCAGHSFTPNTSWITTVQVIPTCVVLPPTTDSTTSFTTFLIKAKGLLPVLYKIVPPMRTVMLMKPMCGVIEPRCHQIVIVHFKPSQEVMQVLERWKIFFNGREDYVTVTLKGQCDIQSLIIGDNNIVTFPTVQVGWKESIYVLMRNPSIFTVKYLFMLEGSKNLEVEPMEGSICAREQFFIKMYYTGSLCDKDVTQITCRCEAFPKQVIIGRPVFINVVVHTHCAYSQLCSLPNDKDFGEVKYSTSLVAEFYAYNFGISPIHCELGSEGIPKEDLNISLDKATIKPEEKLHIKVCFDAKKLGGNVVDIIYKNSGLDQGEIQLFKIIFSCVHPVIQIEEIIDHNFNHLFSKRHLWGLLNLTELNHILNSITFGETKVITCHVPDYEVDDDTKYIKLLLANKTNFKIDISLKRVKKCNCEAAETKSLTLRKKVYLCHHREMLEMKMAETEILPKCEAVLTLEVKYTEAEQNTLCYVLSLTDERFVEINLVITAFSLAVSTLSSYIPSQIMELKDTFIGDQHPPLQIFWLYNNTAQSINYYLDNLEIIKLCNYERFEIMRCLNPLDIVEAYSAGPIVFRFQPIEAKVYNVTIPLLLGDKVVELTIQGKGTFDQTVDCYKYFPVINKFDRTDPNVSITLSEDDITFDKIPLWNSLEKTIFLKNSSKDSTFNYQWSNYFIEGIAYIKITPEEGILQPKEVVRTLIKVKSFGEPLITHVALACKLLDQSQLLLHEASKAAYEKKAEEFQDYFTITDNNKITYPKVEIKIIPPPNYFHRTVGINIEILSSLDYSLHQKIEEIFKSVPPNILSVNNIEILKQYVCKLSKDEIMIKALSSGKTKMLNQLNIMIDEEVEITGDTSDIITETLTRLLAELVFSDEIRHIAEEEARDFTTFYHQYRFSEGVQHITNEKGEREYVVDNVGDLKSTEKRIVETRKFLDCPQPQAVAEELRKCLNWIFDFMFQKMDSLRSMP